jgi:hypothetical protein
MKSMFSKSIIAILLFACVFWINCGKDKSTSSDDTVDNTNFTAERSFSYGVEVVDHSQLSLEAINGNIKITGKSGSDSVIITGIRRVGSESTQDAEEHLKFLEVSVEDLGNKVLVKTIQPEKTYGRSYQVNYAITLPEDLKVVVSSVNGNVTLDSINNEVVVSNVNGTITLDEIYGSVFVTLTNGGIDGEITMPQDGLIEMILVNGNIVLNIPVETSAAFAAGVTNGNIVVSNLTLKDQIVTSSSLSGTLGEGRGTISLITVNGNINVSGF